MYAHDRNDVDAAGRKLGRQRLADCVRLPPSLDESTVGPTAVPCEGSAADHHVATPALRFDGVDARWPDDDVIDVGPAAGDATVMEHDPTLRSNGASAAAVRRSPSAPVAHATVVRRRPQADRATARPVPTAANVASIAARPGGMSSFGPGLSLVFRA